MAKAKPTKSPLKGTAKLNDTKHSTNKYAAGRPPYAKPYGKKGK
jgi:hypothetical protein